MFTSKRDAGHDWLEQVSSSTYTALRIVATNVTADRRRLAVEVRDVADTIDPAVFGFHEHFDVPSNEAYYETVAVVITDAGDVEYGRPSLPSSPATTVR